MVKPLGSDWLFLSNGGGKLSGMAMSMLLRRIHEANLKAGGAGYRDLKQNKPATVHGFRSSFRDWADERTNYSHETKEMAISHVIGNKAEAAYRRGGWQHHTDSQGRGRIAVSTGAMPDGSG